MTEINVEDYIGMIRVIVAKYRRGKPIEDSEELSDAYYGFAMAVKNYKPAKGIFGTYLWHCIERNIWKGIASRNKRSKETTNFDWVAGEVVLGEYVECQDDQPKLIKRIAVDRRDDQQTARLKLVLREIYVRNRTLQSVGDELDLSRERIRQLRDEGLTRLREGRL